MDALFDRPLEIDRRRLSIALASLHFLICMALLPFHEMWRDEIQAWLIARDTASLAELYAVLRHEGHPGLWHLCLKLLNLLTGSPLSMQVFHVGIATATVFVFVRFSPFSSASKVLFSLGYFPLYEYALISRNYAVSMLLLFCFCALFERRREHPWLIGGTVFLLANTNVPGLIIAMVIAALLIHDRRTDRDGRAVAPHASPDGAKTCGSRDSDVEFRLAVLFMLAGVALSFLQLLPGPHSGFASAADPRVDRIGIAFVALVNGFVPAVGPLLRFSGDPVSSAWIYPTLAPALVALLLWHAFRIRRRTFALLFLLASTTGLLLFFGLVFAGLPRHHGFLFFVFLASLWLAGGAAASSRERVARGHGEGGGRRFGRALTFVLATQTIAGVAAACVDVRHTFSHGRNVADFLRSHGLAEEPIVAYPDAPTSTVLGYLPARDFHYPQLGGDGSFIRWTRQRARSLSALQIVCAGRALGRELGQDVIILTTTALDVTGRGTAPSFGASELELLAAFTGSLVPSESYHVYRAGRPGPRPHEACVPPAPRATARR